MKFMAYIIRRNKMVESGEHSTREDAAREIFARFPNVKSCSTAVAVLDGNVWRTYGKDIRPVNKRDLA